MDARRPLPRRLAPAALLGQVLGRRREVRLVAATVPGLRFVEDCPAQENASWRNASACGGSTYPHDAGRRR